MMKVLSLFNLVLRKCCWSLQDIPVAAAILFPLYCIRTIQFIFSCYICCDSVFKNSKYMYYIYVYIYMFYIIYKYIHIYTHVYNVYTHTHTDVYIYIVYIYIRIYIWIR